MHFQIQLGVAPVLGPIIFLSGVEAEGEDFIHWFLLLAGGEPVSQRLLSSVEGHLQAFNRSNLLDATFHSVTLTLQQQAIATVKPDGHTFRRLCGNKMTTD